ncbi:MFS transporter [Peribacillus saganii]|uniref:MFS transporter n=2 Tax=Peribacillus saganii TaxID=2303992 RepID=A0A372LFC5_9BACI|nr:MFS transporter [Peribacillus saganii]
MDNHKHPYYGWYIVISASVICLLTMGMRMGIGPFMEPIMADLDLSRTELSFIVAIGMIVYGMGMPIAGLLVSTFSTRFMMLTGLTIVCLSIVGTVSSKGLVSFLLFFGVFLSLGLSFLSNISFAPIISKWFIRQKGKALFYLSTGGMAGIAIMTPLEMWLIHLVGWQQTLLIFAGVFICIVTPSAIFVMREDVPKGADSKGTVCKQERQVSTDITLRDALKTKAYWQIVLGLFACGFGMNLLGSHGVPMLMDHGYEPMVASFGIGTIGVVAIFSTIILGQIADRFPRKNILFLVYFVRGLGFFGLVLAATNWQLFIVAISGGLVWSGSIAMSTAIISDLFGQRLLGILNGWAFFIGHQIAAALGSFLGGRLYEVFGTHFLSFSTAGALAIIASLASIRLPQHISYPKQIKLGEQHNLVK